MTPSRRSLRTASWAAAMDDGRPIAKGKVIPGNKTVWRTGKTISASGGSEGWLSLLPAGSGAGAFAMIARPMSQPFCEGEKKAAVHELRAAELEPCGRELDAALEAAVGRFQPADRGGPPPRWELPLPVSAQ